MQHRSHNTKASGTPSTRWPLPLALMGCLMALAPHAVLAQTVYRIVGADGKVTFSDKPAPTDAKVTGVETAPRAPNASGPVLPYELREVVNKYPVTLYTARDCGPCDSGRSLLRGRGIPFAEKTVNTPEDADSLQRISGSTSLPFLTVGTQQIKGFSDAEWGQYLDVAGYPEKSVLHPGYRYPAPAPLVAAQVPVAATPNAKASAAAAGLTPAPPPPRVNPSNPAGIQF